MIRRVTILLGNMGGTWSKRRWDIIDVLTGERVGAGRTMSQAIYRVEEEGWILEPNT